MVDGILPIVSGLNFIDEKENAEDPGKGRFVVVAKLNFKEAVLDRSEVEKGRKNEGLVDGFGKAGFEAVTFLRVTGVRAVVGVVLWWIRSCTFFSLILVLKSFLFLSLVTSLSSISMRLKLL